MTNPGWDNHGRDSRDRTSRTGPLGGQNNLDRSAWQVSTTDEPGQYSSTERTDQEITEKKTRQRRQERCRITGRGSLKRTQMVLDTRDRTTRSVPFCGRMVLTGQIGQDKNGTGHLGQDIWKRTARTGHPRQVRQDKSVWQVTLYRKERRGRPGDKNICNTYRFAKMFMKTKILWNILAKIFRNDFWKIFATILKQFTFNSSLHLRGRVSFSTKSASVLNLVKFTSPPAYRVARYCHQETKSCGIFYPIILSRDALVVGRFVHTECSRLSIHTLVPVSPPAIFFILCFIFEDQDRV